MKEQVILMFFLRFSHPVNLVEGGERGLSQISTFAGNGLINYMPSGPATSTSIFDTRGVWGDSMGNVFVTENGHRVVKRVDADTDAMTTVAGHGQGLIFPDIGDGGPATSATLNNPLGLWGGADGTYYIADFHNNAVRCVSGDGIITTVAGNRVNAASSGDGGPATAAVIQSPFGVWLSSVNVLYISDQAYGIRVVDLAAPFNRTISTVSITSGLTAAQVWGNDDDQLYVGTWSYFVKKLNFNDNPPTMTNFAGTGSDAIPVVLDSGQATSIPLRQPIGIAADQHGISYITEYFAHIVRMIDPNGHMTVLVGSGVASASATAANGDGGPPTSATLNKPYHIFCYESDVVYIAEVGGNKIRKLYNITPTSQPSGQPTVSPSTMPTSQPSQPPGQPSKSPTDHPSAKPSSQPTATPSSCPVSAPSSSPSNAPSAQPTTDPTSQPSRIPSGIPSVQPSSRPSTQPSARPSSQPSWAPSSVPTIFPTMQPSAQPSDRPSAAPSDAPSSQPSCRPTVWPSSQPSVQPFSVPSGQPTDIPSIVPSCRPSVQPTADPTSRPSAQPSYRPSIEPTTQPTRVPSAAPSSPPSSTPSVHPSVQPTTPGPTGHPSTQPTSVLSQHPSAQPSNAPSEQPVCAPTTHPSNSPSRAPSLQPTNQPSERPSSQPISSPTVIPSTVPSVIPTSQPSVCLSNWPSSAPSARPTQLFVGESEQPSALPVMFPQLYPSQAPYSATTAPSVRPSVFSRISVNYRDGVSNKTHFKMVLPFLFTTVVSSLGLTDVTVVAAQNASAHLLLGSDRSIVAAVLDTKELQFIGTALSFDFSGRSVADAGDVNGDGHDDLIIGVPYASRVYVLFGTVNGFVNMTEGFTVFGVKSSDLTGWSVSGAGDVNNDTYADIAIGAPTASTGGSVYVLYGHNHSLSDVLLLDISKEHGYKVRGAASQDAFGLSVSGAGDVNGDGYDDIIVGALRQGSFSAGTAYVLFGNATRSDLVAASALLTSEEGRVYVGQSWSWLGYSVSGAGDVNDDQVSDVIIGSAPRRSAVGVPVSYLLFGNQTLPPSGAMTATADVMIVGGGVIVAGVGDVDGDQFDDVLIVSDVDVSTGEGFLVQLSVALVPASTAPSVSPTAPPSARPSTVPSATPTRTPTRPTAVPTQAPSGPTYNPTMTPTQPTPMPSGQPTAPSVLPTRAPSTLPSATPTVAPSVEPTASPTERPSAPPTVLTTRQPTTAIPTPVPSTIHPSRYPVVRPSAPPSLSVAPNIRYAVVAIVTSGTYIRNTTQTQFIVNVTGVVDITGSGGRCMFTILPQPESITRIEGFNTSSDILDLRAFTGIKSYTDLNLTQVTTGSRRLLRSLSVFRDTNSILSTTTSVTIYLPRSQAAELRGVSSVDLHSSSSSDRVWFSAQNRGPVSDDTDTSSSSTGTAAVFDSNVVSLVVTLSLVTAAVLFLLQKSCRIYITAARLRDNESAEPYTLDIERNQNRTFVTYIGGDDDDDDEFDDWFNSINNGSSSSSSSNSYANDNVDNNNNNSNSSGVGSVVVSSEDVASGKEDDEEDGEGGVASLMMSDLRIAGWRDSYYILEDSNNGNDSDDSIVLSAFSDASTGGGRGVYDARCDRSQQHWMGPDGACDVTALDNISRSGRSSSAESPVFSGDDEEEEEEEEEDRRQYS